MIENYQKNEMISTSNPALPNQEALSSVEPASASLEMSNVQHFSLKSALNAGYKFATLVGNRSINLNHVKALAKSAFTDLRFTASGEVCSAKAALMQGLSLSDFVTGQRISLETPDIDHYLCVLDGQHRICACLQENYDMDFLLIDAPEKIADYVQRINCTKSEWSVNDIRHSRLSKGETDPLDELTQFFLEKYVGLRQKTIETALTGKQCSKQDAASGKIPPILSGREELAGAEFSILSLICTTSNKSPMLFESWSKLHELIDDCSNEKAKFLVSKELLVCIANADEAELDILRKALDNKDFGNFKDKIAELYGKFTKGTPIIDDEMVVAATKKADEHAEVLKSKAKTRFVGGSPQDVLAQFERKRKSKKSKSHETAES